MRVRFRVRVREEEEEGKEGGRRKRRMELIRRREVVRMVCATMIMMTPSNGNNDPINRRANTRAPVPVNVTKSKRTGNIENKKNRIAGARVFLCVFVFVMGRRRSRSSRREMKEKEEREEWI